MKEKELIFSNEKSFLWDFYSENAIECMTSDENDPWLLIRFWTDTLWESIDSEMENLFDYSKKWLIKIENDNEEHYTSFNLVESWDVFKSRFLKDMYHISELCSNRDYLEIYDCDGELQFEFAHNGENYLYRVRKLNIFGQAKYTSLLNSNGWQIDLPYFEDLWDSYTVLPYFSEYRDGGDVTLLAMDGSETTVEVRCHE